MNRASLTTKAAGETPEKPRARSYLVSRPASDTLQNDVSGRPIPSRKPLQVPQLTRAQDFIDARLSISVNLNKIRTEVRLAYSIPKVFSLPYGVTAQRNAQRLERANQGSILFILFHHVQSFRKMQFLVCEVDQKLPETVRNPGCWSALRPTDLHALVKFFRGFSGLVPVKPPEHQISIAALLGTACFGSSSQCPKRAGLTALQL